MKRSKYERFFTPDSLQAGHRLEMTIATRSETHDIWFACNDLPLHPSGNALLTPAIFPAMRTTLPGSPSCANAVRLSGSTVCHPASVGKIRKFALDDDIAL